MPDYRTPEPCKVCEKEYAEIGDMCRDCYEDWLEEKIEQLTERE